MLLIEIANLPEHTIPKMRATQLSPVEGLKKKRHAMLSSHCILYMFLGHHLGSLSFEDAFDWKGHTPSCSGAGHWHPQNNVGIAVNTRAVSQKPKVFCWDKKASKMLESCPLPASPEHFYTTGESPGHDPRLPGALVRVHWNGQV